MQLGLPLSTQPQVQRRAGQDATVFVRHRWARRYILRVLDDGTLRVTLPRWGSKREAKAFAERSEPWVTKQRLKQQARPRVVHADEAALKVRAAQELPPRLLALAETHGVTVTRVSIRNQKSRWGACTGRGVITLNWRLILVPDHVRDYVMIHELMHRRELNHSPRFWRHVAGACPEYVDAKRWLLKDGQRLFTGEP